MDVALQGALAGPDPTVVTLIQIDLPGGPVRWVKEGGVVPVGLNQFVGLDETFGVVSRIEAPTDGADGQVSRCNITVEPATNEGVALLTAATAQGSPVEVWLGAIDRNTGQLIGQLETLFFGELDFGDMNVGEKRVLVLDCGTEEGRMMEANAERKLSNSFHQSVWPEERGLEYVTSIKQKVSWRAKEPAGSGSGASGATNPSKSLLARALGA